MSLEPYRKIAFDGLWKNNQALVALLGLCPLLAVSNSVINSLGLGLATTFALVFSNTIVSSIRNRVSNEVRLPVFVLVIACNVTVIELLMNAYFHDLHNILGIFIPLIVTNCAIIGRAEAFASKNTVDKALADGFFMGLGFTLALVALGALREMIGTGTLFARADLMFGEIARNWSIRVFHDYGGFLLAILPPGAFIGLGLVIAVKNLIDARTAIETGGYPGTGGRNRRQYPSSPAVGRKSARPDEGKRSHGFEAPFAGRGTGDLSRIERDIAIPPVRQLRIATPPLPAPWKGNPVYLPCLGQCDSTGNGKTPYR